jgi:hypothetical protein
LAELIGGGARLVALTILHHHHLPELQWYANALPLKYRIFVSIRGAVTTQALNPRMRALLRT